MTISVWRYSHLALAVSSFIFIALAAVTGMVLAVEPINEKFPAYNSADLKQITVAQTLPVLRKTFTEISEVTVDVHQFVLVKGTDNTGADTTAYVNASNGNIIGAPGKKNEFLQWVTALHRSLFLHETGRFFVGLTSFLLLLIALSGTVLIIQRQRSFKRFFAKIVQENFAQYYHVVLGRLSLIPIILIALTGTYLSLQKFGFFPEKKITHNIDFDNIKSEPAQQPADFTVFKNIKLADVQSIEFPFSDDVEDYFTLKLKDREIVVNQFNGETLSNIPYPMTTFITNLSLDLHTGRKSMIWSVLLGIACINILFFIYSGFAMTLKRRKNKIKNKYKASESTHIILVGSENGSTLEYANAVHQQLISIGQKAFLTELNSYTFFPKATQFIVITATYGLGNPPTNATKFIALVEKYKQPQPIQFSVVGFGSHAYPDFCRFAYDVNNALTAQSWASSLVEIHTVNDRSPDQFNQWFDTWAQKAALPAMVLPEKFHQKPERLATMVVTQKSVHTNDDGTFLIRLQPGARTTFTSGDLLAIYPADDYRERFYSIGKMDKAIQLSVRLHEQGLGSSFLHQLQKEDTISAKIISNTAFHFPAKATAVMMISNGTGIAPFLGMIDQNKTKLECHLYCGFRTAASFNLYAATLQKNSTDKKLQELHVAYSRQGEKQYVKDLLERDSAIVAKLLANDGVLMLCGSLSMQHDVIALLERICQERNGKGISFYQSHGQVLMDCY